MKTSQSWRRAARVLACLVLAGGACLAHAEQACKANDAGCAIFNGQRDVKAHLRDDNYALPPSTTRCVNCHAQADPKGVFAPPLTPAFLKEAKSRRGGPPSSYDPSSFCRAVRDGIDPANVLLRKSMPHFQITDAECSALWKYIATR
jgi:hypothetical protein